MKGYELSCCRGQIVKAWRSCCVGNLGEPFRIHLMTNYGGLIPKNVVYQHIIHSSKYCYSLFSPLIQDVYCPLLSRRKSKIRSLHLSVCLTCELNNLKISEISTSTWCVVGFRRNKGPCWKLFTHLNILLQKGSLASPDQFMSRETWKTLQTFTIQQWGTLACHLFRNRWKDWV